MQNYRGCGAIASAQAIALKRAIAITWLHILACGVRRRTNKYTGDTLNGRDAHTTQTMRWADAKRTLRRWRKRWAMLNVWSTSRGIHARTKTGVIMIGVIVMVIGKKTSADWHHSEMTILQAVRGIRTSWQGLLVGRERNYRFRHTVINSDVELCSEQPGLEVEVIRWICLPMQTTDLIF